jgi:ABC-type nitrate/sulfonate/bicarbonate transport system substrate-binding protein
VIRAFYRAVRYAQEHPDEAWRIMSERERVTPEEFRSSMQSGISLVPLTDQQSFLGEKSSLRPVVARVSQLLKEQGLLSSARTEHDLLNAHPAELAVQP